MRRESRSVLITGYVDDFLWTCMGVKAKSNLACSVAPRAALVSQLRKSSSGEVSEASQDMTSCPED